MSRLTDNSYQQQQQPPQYQPAQQQDVVSGEQYRYLLTNFKIAHEKVEQQRAQLEEQENQVAQLRQRIDLLEGGSSGPDRFSKGGNTVDDFSIKNAAAQLDKLINRWSSEVVRSTTNPIPLPIICKAILNDLSANEEIAALYQGTPMQVQYLLRHAIAESISEGIINCLLVTNSSEANIQLSRIHEHIFSRDPTVARVWRRQTFSAAVEHCTPDMTRSIMSEHIPELTKLFNAAIPTSGDTSVLESAFEFSRMLHGSGGSGDAFYRSFVPEIGGPLYPGQIELVKRCLKSEKGDVCRVGASMFPGLVKVTKDPQTRGNVQTVVRRAQVICECALIGSG